MTRALDSFGPLALLLAAAGLAPLAAQADRDGAKTGAATLALESVTLTIPGGKVTAERGSLRVPIVRADPASKVIEIDVWRFRAREGAPDGAPPVFRLNGGPGWPGFEPRTLDWEGEVAPFVETSDLVVVGQRGIGTSKPDTTCDAVMAGADRPGLDATRAERAAFLRKKCGECRAHWEALGYDLSGLNVKEAAADVDDVRRLLGYDRIVLWGNSFGSHWGMAIMRYHPEGVARAVLAGMEGPDHTYDMPSGVLHSLERMAKAAERAPELAGHIPDEGLLAAFQLVVESVEAEPVELELPHPRTGAPVKLRLDGDAARAMALGYTARASSRAGIASWPADILALYRGDFERAARAALEDDGLDLPTASFFMLDCGSGITRARLETLRKDPAARIVGDLGWFYEVTCPAWESDVGDDFRTGFKTRIPTVVVQGTWDVSTPFDNALELLPCFEDVHFIPVEGGSHGALTEALRSGDEFRAAITEFLVTGATDDLPDELTLPDLRWVVPD